VLNDTKRIRRMRKRKLSTVGEKNLIKLSIFGEFTLVGLTRTGLRNVHNEIIALVECAE
jgi:hypothetical protein